jgi:hypothetical protein
MTHKDNKTARDESSAVLLNNNNIDNELDDRLREILELFHNYDMGSAKDGYSYTIEQIKQAIEKDILELIGEDERKPEAAVLGIDGRKKYAPGQVASHVKARNELRAELRLKLKEYIGTLDRSTNGNEV